MAFGFLIDIFCMKVVLIVAWDNSKHIFFSHGLFSSLELHEPSKEKKRLILFAGVLQLLEYGSVNHCTGLLPPVFKITG